MSEDLQGKRILVVDDNENSRLVLCDMLERMGFEVDQTQSGKSAITTVGRSEAQGMPYDIVFLDWKMPVMDGIETAKRIRELSPGSMPHMIMVTGHGREEVSKSAEEAGIEDVLVKPVGASALFDSVVRILGDAGESVRIAGVMQRNTFDQFITIRGARVLLVDDNELNLEVANELLRNAGLVVDLAENGRFAVEKVKAADYDLVLMDMQMPVMDGLTATLEIRRDEHFKDLPIVAMTANAMQGDRDRCIRAGMNDHVAKPIDPENLWKALLKWIKPRQSTAEQKALPAAMRKNKIGR